MRDAGRMPRRLRRLGWKPDADGRRWSGADGAALITAGDYYVWVGRDPESPDLGGTRVMDWMICGTRAEAMAAAGPRLASDALDDLEHRGAEVAARDVALVESGCSEWIDATDGGRWTALARRAGMMDGVRADERRRRNRGSLLGLQLIAGCGVAVGVGQFILAYAPSRRIESLLAVGLVAGASLAFSWLTRD